MEIREEYFLCRNCKHYDRFEGNCKAFPEGVVPTGETEPNGEFTKEETALRNLWHLDENLPLEEFKKVFHSKPIDGQKGNYIYEPID